MGKKILSEARHVVKMSWRWSLIANIAGIVVFIVSYRFLHLDIYDCITLTFGIPIIVIVLVYVYDSSRHNSKLKTILRKEVEKVQERT